MHDPAHPAPWTNARHAVPKPVLYKELAQELEALLTG